MARYRYLVADLVSGVIREEVPFGNVSYTNQLNGAGSFSGTIGLYHPKTTRSNLAINQTSVYVERDNRIVWSGFINTAPVEPGVSVNVNAIGYHNYFERRSIKRDFFFMPAMDKLHIVRTLVDYVQTLSNGNIGVLTGSELSGVLTPLIIGAFERKYVGEVISHLASNAAGGGFDYGYEAAWEGPTNDQDVVKRLKLYYPYRGSVQAITSGLSLTYGANFQEYTYGPDGSSQETVVDGIGPGEASNSIIFSAADPGGFAPIFDGVGSYKDVTSPAMLWWLTVVRLYALKAPKENLTITTRPGAVTVGTFTEGDFIHVDLQDGPYVQVDGWYRIDNYTVTVSDEGEEKITFALVNPFAYYGS